MSYSYCIPWILFIFGLPDSGVAGLELVGMSVPHFGVLHRPAVLECSFALGNDTLYALKWYKDGHEFFRFNPSAHAQGPNASATITVFPVFGISVNANRSSLHQVHLEPITIGSKGDYRCEISADAPSFKTVAKEKFMGVMVLPHKGPKISGVFPWYNIGDNFTANCTVKKSSPQAQLTWFLNDKEIESELCNCIASETIESGKTGDGIQFFNTRTMLSIHLDMNVFKDGALALECRATFTKSPIVLKDAVTSNIKAGLGLQYTDNYGSSAPKTKMGICSIFLVISGLVIANYNAT